MRCSSWPVAGQRFHLPRRRGGQRHRLKRSDKLTHETRLGYQHLIASQADNFKRLRTYITFCKFTTADVFQNILYRHKCLFISSSWNVSVHYAKELNFLILLSLRYFLTLVFNTCIINPAETCVLNYLRCGGDCTLHPTAFQGLVRFKKGYEKYSNNRYTVSALLLVDCIFNKGWQ